jgi:hypothetical protein
MTSGPDLTFHSKPKSQERSRLAWLTVHTLRLDRPPPPFIFYTSLSISVCLYFLQFGVKDMAASIDLTGVIHPSSSPFTAWSKIKRSSSKYDMAHCSAATLTTGDVASTAAPEVERSVVRLGLPSKGRMSEQTLNLLKACLIIDSVPFSILCARSCWCFSHFVLFVAFQSCQLTVRKPNPRQYTADIPLVIFLSSSFSSEFLLV